MAGRQSRARTLVVVFGGPDASGRCYALGSTSGAHINRAVTFSMAVRGRLLWREIIPYVIAQLAGAAVLGGLLIVATFERGAAGLGGGERRVQRGAREVRHRDRAKGEQGEDSSGEQEEVRYRVGLGK